MRPKRCCRVFLLVTLSGSLLTCSRPGAVRASLARARNYCTEVGFPEVWQYSDGTRDHSGPLRFRRFPGTLRFPVVAVGGGYEQVSLNTFVLDLSGSPRVEPVDQAVWRAAEELPVVPDPMSERDRAWNAGFIYWRGKQYKPSGSRGITPYDTVVPSPGQKFLVFQSVDPGWFQVKQLPGPTTDPENGTGYVDVYEADSAKRLATIELPYNGGTSSFANSTLWLTDRLLAVRADGRDRSVVICRFPDR